MEPDSAAGPELSPGRTIVVRTPDRHAFPGTLLEIRGEGEHAVGVVRLDTGWQTTFPLRMIHARETQ